ncbi:MAG: DUF2088 domain-containing protein [Firmicutes bacterium]|nr:DUF2088 domain-containing protein [Bacillota bacterium]
MAIALPPVARVTQSWPRPAVPEAELAEHVRRALADAFKESGLRPGSRVAVTVGSRGIARLPELLRAIVVGIRELEGDPVLVSAMGSHGGGTSEGQRRILAGLGVTPETIGAPVLCGTEVVPLGETPEGVPVYCDRDAAGADAILLCNRIKPHTSFRGPVESGLLKILAVGLGKHPGASAIHRRGPEALGAAITSAAAAGLARLPVAGGIAILENAYHETAGIVGVPAARIPDVEPGLLQRARGYLPGIPAEELDVLVIWETGKCFSGTGMDTNVIGRMRIHGIPEPERPLYRRIVVLRLAPASEGNANGIGLADFTTRRLVEAVDFDATYTNGLTSTFTQRAMIPITMKSDREALEAALETLGFAGDAAEAKVGIIRNTLELEDVYLSPSAVAEVMSRSEAGIPADFVIHGGFQPLSFDDEGRLQPPWDVQGGENAAPENMG